ncbi:MAG: glycosyltransferase [Chloroflexi bacterium]|nr:glycosyltransferase [Chloroflexota bacterium]
MLSVSIVTPSYNHARYIERTIASILSQADDLDFLVVDGASTDGTLEILRRYEPRLRWISEPDNGQTHAVNKGIARTRGDIIGWINSDDLYYPGAVEAARRCFEQHPDIDVVYGAADHIDEQDQPFEAYPTEPWSFERLKEICFLCQPAVFFRRRAAERAGPLDEQLYNCMDYEYWLRLAQTGANFVYVDRKLAGSRMYPENKTLANRVRAHAEYNRMMRSRLGRVPDRWLFNYAHAVLERTPIRRDDPLRFAVVVSAVSIYAALRWNRGVSRSMLNTTTRWVGDNVRVKLRAAVAR